VNSKFPHQIEFMRVHRFIAYAQKTSRPAHGLSLSQQFQNFPFPRGQRTFSNTTFSKTTFLLKRRVV